MVDKYFFSSLRKTFFNKAEILTLVDILEGDILRRNVEIVEIEWVGVTRNIVTNFIRKIGFFLKKLVLIF